MATIIALTPNQPAAVNGPAGAATKMNLWEAFDASPYDYFDLELGVDAINLAGGANITIALETSMQNEVDDASWQQIASWASLGTAPNYSIKSIDKGFLRYLRWNVSVITTNQSIAFWIRGIGRRYGSP